MSCRVPPTTHNDYMETYNGGSTYRTNIATELTSFVEVIILLKYSLNVGKYHQNPFNMHVYSMIFDGIPNIQKKHFLFC